MKRKGKEFWVSRGRNVRFKDTLNINPNRIMVLNIDGVEELYGEAHMCYEKFFKFTGIKLERGQQVKVRLEVL